MQQRRSTYIFHKIRQELLDFTLYSPIVSIHIGNWHVTEADSILDHKHLLFDYNAAEIIKVEYKDPTITNWELHELKLLSVELSN